MTAKEIRAQGAAWARRYGGRRGLTPYKAWLRGFEAGARAAELASSSTSLSSDDVYAAKWNAVCAAEAIAIAAEKAASK